MEGLRSLEDIIEEDRMMQMKVENAFAEVPKNRWESLRKYKSKFYVGIEPVGRYDFTAPIAYTIVDGLFQGSLLSKYERGMMERTSGVYVAKSMNGEYNIVKNYPVRKMSVFFATKSEGKYVNVASVNTMTKGVEFDRRELTRISEKKLVKLAYEINQYLNVPGAYNFNTGRSRS